MKIISNSLIVLLLISYASANEQIKQMDSFADHKRLDLRYDPFKVQNSTVETIGTDPKQKEKKIMVISIFNSKAYINGQWYEKDDAIGSFKITKIVKDGVYIKMKNKIMFYPLNENKNFINFKKGSND